MYYIILGRIAVLHRGRPMRPVVTDGVVAFMVRLSVGLSVTIVDSGFRVDPRNHALDERPGKSRSPMRMGNFEGEKGRPNCKVLGHSGLRRERTNG